MILHHDEHAKKLPDITCSREKRTTTLLIGRKFSDVVNFSIYKQINFQNEYTIYTHRFCMYAPYGSPGRTQENLKHNLKSNIQALQQARTCIIVLFFLNLGRGQTYRYIEKAHILGQSWQTNMMIVCLQGMC